MEVPLHIQYFLLCSIISLSSCFPWIKPLHPHININSSIKIDGRRAEGFNLCWNGKHGLRHYFCSPIHCSSLRRPFFFSHIPYDLPNVIPQSSLKLASLLLSTLTFIFCFLRLYEADHLATKQKPGLFHFIS